MRGMVNANEISMPSIFVRQARASVRRFVTLCIAASLVLTAACQNKAEQSLTGTAPNAKEAAHASDMTAGAVPRSDTTIAADTTPVDTQVTDVRLSDKGDEHSLTGIETSQFKPSDSVFMSIRTKGTASKYTLSSKWLTPSGETLTEYSQVISVPGQVETIFSLSKPDGWAKGQYRVELTINGKPMRTASFTVR